jgi:hypothetical protein
LIAASPWPIVAIITATITNFFIVITYYLTLE